MAILTAKYTEAQKNDGSLNTTPHELNAAMGLIGGNPNGRIQSVTDYVKKSPDFVATVTSSPPLASSLSITVYKNEVFPPPGFPVRRITFFFPSGICVNAS